MMTLTRSLTKSGIICIAALTSIASSHSRSGAKYHVIRRVVIDTGQSDYLALDPVGRRLYGAAYKVVDIDSYSVVGDLPPHTGHGFALATDYGRGLGRHGVLFDTKSLRALGHVNAVGDGIAYDSATHRAFLFDRFATVVDVASGSIIDSVDLSDATPTRILGAAADDRGRVYVALWVRTDSTPTGHITQLAVLDARSLKVVNRWHLPSCFEGRGVSVDRSHHHVYVSCLHSLAVVDIDRGVTVASVSVPGAAEVSAVDESIGRILNPTGDDAFAVVERDRTDRFRMIEIDTVPGIGNSIAVDPRTHRVFAVANVRDTISLVVLSP